MNKRNKLSRSSFDSVQRGAVIAQEMAGQDQRRASLIDSIPASEIHNIALDELKISPNNARSVKNQDDVSIRALAESIERSGLLSPILIDENKFIIAGQRRFAAYQLLANTVSKDKFGRIPAMTLSERSSDQVLELSLLENLARRDLSVQEKKDGITKLFALYKSGGRELTSQPNKFAPDEEAGEDAAIKREIAAMLGITKRWVNHILKEVGQLDAEKTKPTISVGSKRIVIRFPELRLSKVNQVSIRQELETLVAKYEIAGHSQF